MLGPVWKGKPQSYAFEELMFTPGIGAASGTFTLPVILKSQHVSRDYAEAYFTEPALMAGARIEALAEWLEHDTAHVSAIQRAARHPAFGQLANLGKVSSAMAVRRLTKTHRPLWLFFLQRTTGERPAEGATTVDAAAELWRQWGRDRGFV